MLQPCRVCLPAVSVPTLFLHVFCCAVLQDEKAAFDERHDLRNGNDFNCLLVSLACA
jgi:hypothetical protein